jgi:hypothetical protein
MSTLTNITSKQQTWFKKQPVAADTLPNEQKAKVYQGRSYPIKIVLKQQDGHTQLDLGSLGIWWVFDAHWLGLTPEQEPYAVDGNLKYLRNFSYFWQQDNGPEGWRQCQTSSIAMCLKYLGVKSIKDDVDYLHYVNKHGDTTTRDAQFKALADLGVVASFKTNLDSQDIKNQIKKGKPVAVGILHHGTVDSPRGGGHFIVITGYSDSGAYWLVQDPFGQLDLVAGGWHSRGRTSGKNQHYSFANMNPRLFVSGGADGWGWVF